MHLHPYNWQMWCSPHGQTARDQAAPKLSWERIARIVGFTVKPCECSDTKHTNLIQNISKCQIIPSTRNSCSQSTIARSLLPAGAPHAGGHRRGPRHCAPVPRELGVPRGDGARFPALGTFEVQSSLSASDHQLCSTCEGITWDTWRCPINSNHTLCCSPDTTRCWGPSF